MSKLTRLFIPTKKKILSEEYDWIAGSDEKEEEDNGEKVLENVQGVIEFKNVSFMYETSW